MGCCESAHSPSDFLVFHNHLPTTIQLRLYVSYIDGLGVERSEALTAHEYRSDSRTSCADVITPGYTLCVPRPSKNPRRHEDLHLLISFNHQSSLPLSGERFRERYGWKASSTVADKWRTRLRHQSSFAILEDHTDDTPLADAARAQSVRSHGLLWLPLPFTQSFTITESLLPPGWKDSVQSEIKNRTVPRLRL
jgi:hypothetical protein